MVKSVIKEIIIVLLLIVAVILAMGVLFYNYIPSNKYVPPVTTYKTAESVEKELGEQITEDETVLVTYEITSEDLKNLQKTHVYDPGKANPFSSYILPVENTEENGITGENGTIGTNVNSSNGGAGSNNSNTFYKNTGTK